MQTLFSKDMVSLDFSWMMARVSRCYEQIWEVSEQILTLGGNVAHDLTPRYATERNFSKGYYETEHCPYRSRCERL